MGKRTAIILFVLVFISMTFDYGLLKIKAKTSNGPKISDKVDKTDDFKRKDGKVELNLWANFQGLEWAAGAFNEKYPDISINVKVLTYENFTQTCLDAIANGEGPDLIVCDSSLISAFNENESLQNLLERPFSAGQYRKDFTEGFWKLMSSFDQKRLIGIPTEVNPLVTFYRADIMEQYGFPSDPQRLAEYMKNQDNWLRIAETLIKDNKYISQETTDPFTIYEASASLFDENLNFNRNNEDFKRAIEISRTLYKNELSLSADVWNEKGQEDVKGGKLVMLYMGSWASDYIKSIAPEQKGKWRVTGLPFGVAGLGNSNLAAITSTSKHKEEAWKFIKENYLSEGQYNGYGKIPAYLPARDKLKSLSYQDGFLGWQDVLPEYRNLAAEIREPLITPLDYKAKALWDGYKYNFLNYNSISPEDSLKKFEVELNEKVGMDREALLKSIGK